MNPLNPNISPIQGLLLVNKPKGKSSFDLVRILRKILNVKKIGHAGTLDPFATGVMVMLIGREYTKLSDQFLEKEKEYIAEVFLGTSTDTFDNEGQVTATSESVPHLEAIQAALSFFQGTILQTPPMFSAKKINGQKLYDLARQGKSIERTPVPVTLKTEFISYAYPLLHLKVICSKGTYIRAIADDLGKMLGCGAHLTNLTRTRSGEFLLSECLEGSLLSPAAFDTIKDRLIHSES